MSTEADPSVLKDAARRALIREHLSLTGVDYLEVSTGPTDIDQTLLHVHFLAPSTPTGTGPAAKVDAVLTALADPANRRMLQISGGTRIRGVRIVDVKRQSEHLDVAVDRPGDFSDYVLTLDHPSVDPCFGSIRFSFKAGCPDRFDCRAELAHPVAAGVSPPIDYLTKDYQSFRQALLDFLPLVAPSWTERREADFGISLLELFSYIGDRLSYYQDAVANEAYLGTARQRVSVRRHARLIDYTVHDGLSAMTFLHCEVHDDVALGGTEPLLALTSPHGMENAPSAIPPDQADRALSSADAVFEVLLPVDPRFRLQPRGKERILLRPEHNAIPIYTWAGKTLTVPAGTTGTDLAGDLKHLAPGDFLLFEELHSPSGEPGRAPDPGHRQVVRLREVHAARQDPLTGYSHTRVDWDEADALNFDLVVAGRLADGTPCARMGVARGNIVPAFHGRTLREFHRVPEDERPGTRSPRGYRLALDHTPLSFLPAEDVATLSVADLHQLSPRGALPAVMQLRETSADGIETPWFAVAGDLLNSGRFDRHVTVETDDDGHAVVRFGDDDFGAAPAPGTVFAVDLRIGAGPGGNVGADSLRHFLDAPGLGNVRCVRNALPAWGGTEPEPLDAVRVAAPSALHAGIHRAVTAEDYARVAMEHPRVRGAVARFRWTGSWHTVFLYVDPADAAALTPALARDVDRWIRRAALAGHDISIKGPAYVPLMVDLELCVAPGHHAQDVEQAVLQTLTSGHRPVGARGFFHPDHHGFGQSLYLSALLTAAQQVPGVDSVTVTTFERRYDPDPAATARNVEHGLIRARPLEVLRLDNDPSFPENGLLTVTARN